MLVPVLATTSLVLTLPATALLVITSIRFIRTYLVTDDRRLLLIGVSLGLLAASMAMVIPSTINVIYISSKYGLWMHGWRGARHHAGGAYCWWWNYLLGGYAPPTYLITFILHYVLLTISYATLLTTYLSTRKSTLHAFVGLIMASVVSTEVVLTGFTVSLATMSYASNARRPCTIAFTLLATSHLLSIASIILPAYTLFWVAIAFRAVGVATLTFTLR